MRCIINIHRMQWKWSNWKRCAVNQFGVARTELLSGTETGVHKRDAFYYPGWVIHAYSPSIQTALLRIFYLNVPDKLRCAQNLIYHRFRVRNKFTDFRNLGKKSVKTAFSSLFPSLFLTIDFNRWNVTWTTRLGWRHTAHDSSRCVLRSNALQFYISELCNSSSLTRQQHFLGRMFTHVWRRERTMKLEQNATKIIRAKLL